MGFEEWTGLLVMMMLCIFAWILRSNAEDDDAANDDEDTSQVDSGATA